MAIPVQTSVQGSIKRLLNDNIQVIHGAGGPLSGLAPYGTGAGKVGLGALYIDNTYGTLYVNEGSVLSPYWTPVSFDQRGILGAFTDFRSGVEIALASTAATASLANGIRLHGSGIEETDSGALVTYAEDGPILTITTSAADAKLINLGHNGTTPWFQPNTHGPLTVDAKVSMTSALTLRRFFIGFLGTVADALVTPFTGSTITTTLVQDDMAGMGFDVGFTDADRLYAMHNKSDEAATQGATTGSRDTGSDFPAAGTYTRLRVEISAAGVMSLFKDKALLVRLESCLDVDEEVAPACLVCSTSSAVKVMTVRQFGFWGTRNT